MSDFVAASQPEGLGATMDTDYWTVHQGDARELDNFLGRSSRVAGTEGAAFVQTTITSPPYATLVDYGSENQIGFGQSYDDYLASCREVFQAVHKWTLDTGSLWVIADSLMDKRRKKGSASRLIPLPFDLVRQAEAVGWTLREVIIWRKDRTRPWSHPGKLRNGFEYVLFFVKAESYIFNVDSLRDTANLKSWWVKYPERHNPWGMTPDNVWEIPIPLQGSWDDSAFRHACPFPPELVRRMIALSSDPGDIVLDPFAGSGSVVTGAAREGRLGLGVELNPEYVSLYRDKAPAQLRPKQAMSPVSVMTQRLLELRMLKYPKELSKQVLRAGFTTSQVRAVLMNVESVNYQPARTGYGKISCLIVASDNLSELEMARLAKLMADVSRKAPLSKYGLEVSTGIISINEAGTQFKDAEVAIYTRGRTWYADDKIEGSEVEVWLRGIGQPAVVPIISPLYVRQSLEESF